VAVKWPNAKGLLYDEIKRDDGLSLALSTQRAPEPKYESSVCRGPDKSPAGRYIQRHRERERERQGDER